MISTYEIPSDVANPITLQHIQALTDYTRRMALEHNFSVVKKCMELADNLYAKGNSLVRGYIENIFVFSFSTLLSNCNTIEWKIVQSYMPNNFYHLFVQQVLKSKC